VVPRSGLAYRHGLTLVNAPGLIDRDYRGELLVLALNTDRERPYAIAVGDRIAQLVLIEVGLPRVVEVQDLSATVRGAGGLGSTGS
jgi:dUTP pyrophosphatase